MQHGLGVICERRDKEIVFYFFISFPLQMESGVVKHTAQRGQRCLGYLFTVCTLRPEYPRGNERGATDERSKEGMTPLIPSCFLRHPPGGKFNKVHIPRATQERDENT